MTKKGCQKITKVSCIGRMFKMFNYNCKKKVKKQSIVFLISRLSCKIFPQKWYLIRLQTRKPTAARFNRYSDVLLPDFYSALMQWHHNGSIVSIDKEKYSCNYISKYSCSRSKHKCRNQVKQTYPADFCKGLSCFD